MIIDINGEQLQTLIDLVYNNSQFSDNDEEKEYFDNLLIKLERTERGIKWPITNQ